MKELSAPVFNVRGFSTGYDIGSGRAVLILYGQGHELPIAYVMSPEYARRIGSSLIEIYADHNPTPCGGLN
ncbi:MAG TPA: hypothetical protein VNZ94_01670 [Xanthobacteraceae bacterium]|nr:hypothetical protein [Xanthobacteraceae bacterium]